ncbi:MAG: hypothetical protein DWQ07_09145 [Chloroflexi bacterium]|nr:MAG: hypothetical protein DWQ07_09145 [Chloroflexota bacterium]MBL1193122.1 hypothetical protein [Chloroflexota bacterium]NOH10415.1 hypothetical protein [Chloroflexota bacterium]
MYDILILYDQYTTHIKTILEHLDAFSMYSKNRVFYLPGTRDSRIEIDLSVFDVVVVHYSVRLSLTWHISESAASELRDYQGYKILFIQDEYENTEIARKWINDLNFQLVYTCVPEKYISQIYPPTQFEDVEFINTLTGFVPSSASKSQSRLALDDRENMVGYRGRELPAWYGDLAREKYIIGKKVKEICEERGIRSDIEWLMNKRIYGDGWYKFLENCRVTLGAESGSNVFDENGEIQKNVTQALDQNPSLTYDDLYGLYVAEHEGPVMMNQISPRVFEAIAMRTGLVLFEGEYSGIVKPNVHFIPLKKDFSNIEDVIAKIFDIQYLSSMIERAYVDIISSGKYSYEQFVKGFDEIIKERVLSRNSAKIITGIAGWQVDSGSPIVVPQASNIDKVPIDTPLQYFKEGGENRSQQGLIRFAIDPVYKLFQRIPVFASFIRFLYSIPMARKIINFLLRY